MHTGGTASRSKRLRIDELIKGTRARTDQQRQQGIQRAHSTRAGGRRAVVNPRAQRRVPPGVQRRHQVLSLGPQRRITRQRRQLEGIPYRSPVDQRMHRYFPDFIAHVKQKTGKEKTIVIEIKPERQTKKPIQKRQTKRFLEEAATYAINQEIEAGEHDTFIILQA